MRVNRRTLSHDGRERRVIEVLPDEAAPGAPLILFLHGSRQSGSVARNFTGNSFDELTARGCTVFYPDGVGRHFNDHRVGFQEQARTLLIDDSAFLTSLITHARDEIGTGRVIACGFSNGGQMVQRLALERPGLVDGIACFGAPWPTADNVLPEISSLADGWVPVPVLSVQGTGDPLVPYEGGVSGIGSANRGEARSAIDSARHFAQLNRIERTEPVSARTDDGVRVDRFGPGMPGSPAPEREAPVELWTIEGMGHLVPNPKELSDRIGPGTDKVVGAELVAHFFGL